MTGIMIDSQSKSVYPIALPNDMNQNDLARHTQKYLGESLEFAICLGYFDFLFVRSNVGGTMLTECCKTGQIFYLDIDGASGKYYGSGLVVNVQSGRMHDPVQPLERVQQLVKWNK